MTESIANKTNLLGLDLAGMTEFCAALGEKRFRAAQLLKWIHQRGVGDFDAMTDISKALRAKLQNLAEVRLPEVTYCRDSVDGTRKWVMKMPGGSAVETVFIPEEGRGTLCVSSQIGCALDCSFCSTGKQGFQRDLSSAEIIAQVWVAVQSLNQFDAKASRKVTNVVLMGMGEPLLNFDAVVAAMNLMMDDNAYGLSKRRVTLSTSGVVPAIYELAKVSDVALALSLHAPNDELRSQLVPLNKKYNIRQVLDACNHYMARFSDKRVTTIEYTLIAQINDAPEQAHELTEVLRDTPCKINLIPFNPFPNSGYQRSSNNRIHRFKDILQAAGYNVTIRKTRGDDIDAACGQLVGQVADRTSRSKRYIEAVQLGQTAAELAQRSPASTV